MSLKKAARSPYWRDELLELEQRLLDPTVRGSPQAVIPLLHPDFLEFGSSGRVYTKEMMVQMMVQETPGVVRIRDFDVREITPEVALVTYRTVGGEGRGDASQLDMAASGVGVADRVPPGNQGPQSAL